MEIEIHLDPSALGLAVASRIATRLKAKPTAVLALASGKTPVPIYEALARMHASGAVSFRDATVFGLDEYLGLDGSDPQSFASFFREHLFGCVDLPAERTFVPNGRALDPERECRTYEARIIAAGGIDLCLLGIGVNGHLALNEPAPVLAAQAHVADIAAQTRSAMPPELSAVDRGLTMGMATMMNAKEVILVATGAAKAGIVARLLLPAIDPQVPASFLQLHPNATLAVDAAAGANIVS